jgi:hypothetical protein
MNVCSASDLTKEKIGKRLETTSKYKLKEMKCLRAGAKKQLISSTV